MKHPLEPFFAVQRRMMPAAALTKPVPAFLFVLMIGLVTSLLQAADNTNWERSIVSLEASRKQFDYLQPWTRRMDTSHKNGIVLGRQQILTTADFLNDLTLIRVQKNGRGRWWNAQLQWIDYHANLATVTVTDTNFWNDLDPMILADPVPTKGSIEIVRWRNGILEIRKAEINRLVVKRAKLSFLEHMQMEIDSEINGVGWAEAVVAGNRLIGLAASQEGNNITVLPSSFIRFVLSGAITGRYRGLGFFDFIWQKAQNPATLKFLNLDGEPRGVIILGSATGAKAGQLLKPRDILLKIDGFDIDAEGDYLDPAYRQLSLENLSTRLKWAGDVVRLSIWRDGKPMEVPYPLPKVEYPAELVPRATFGQEPEFLMVGGMVFQPLTEPYLRTWGLDWRRKAPFRLAYYDQEKATPERPARVVFSMVLPDPFNLGYQDYRFLSLDRVNGQSISHLSDLTAAFQKPQNGYHIIEFGRGETIRRLILDATEAGAATKRVMQRYGLEKDRFFATTNSGTTSAEAK